MEGGSMLLKESLNEEAVVADKGNKRECKRQKGKRG